MLRMLHACTFLASWATLHETLLLCVRGEPAGMSLVRLHETRAVRINIVLEIERCNYNEGLSQYKRTVYHPLSLISLVVLGLAPSQD